MRKDRPLSELLKNEKTINKTITKEQVYKDLVNLAFNKAYDDIERNAKKGNQQHVLGPFYRFQIREEYYQAMVEKRSDLYYTELDREYGTTYYLVPSPIFETRQKHGLIGSKSTVSYTQFGNRFIADLQKKFSMEGIVLDFIPYIGTVNGDKKVQVGVPFPTPAAYGGFLGVKYYHMWYDIKH